MIRASQHGAQGHTESLSPWTKTRHTLMVIDLDERYLSPEKRLFAALSVNLHTIWTVSHRLQPRLTGLCYKPIDGLSDRTYFLHS